MLWLILYFWSIYGMNQLIIISAYNLLVQTNFY